MIVDFSKCELSDRNLQYAGRAGEKRGIIYNSDYWFLKFPKNTLSMKRTGELSYVTSPLSEYIGSQIYKIFGFDVHETILGVYNDGRRYKIVCACKDFIKDSKNELFIPYTALRNDTNEKVMSRNDENIISASNLNEIIFQLDNNTVLSKIKEAKSRFWDTVVVDYLINNNDRNEDNWGVIKFQKENKYIMSPIFDNGNSFYSKTDNNRILEILSDNNKLLSSSLNCITAYENDEGDNIHFNELLINPNVDFTNSIKKILDIYKDNIDEIVKMLDEIPSAYNKIEVFSEIRKQYYLRTIQLRADNLIKKYK